MKVMQRVTMKAEYVYLSYSGLEINDATGNEMVVNLTEEQIFEVRDKFIAKCDRIEENRRKLLEEKENADG